MEYSTICLILSVLDDDHGISEESLRNLLHVVEGLAQLPLTQVLKLVNATDGRYYLREGMRENLFISLTALAVINDSLSKDRAVSCGYNPKLADELILLSGGKSPGETKPKKVVGYRNGKKWEVKFI